MLMFSGFELRAPELPDDARVLHPHVPLPGLEDFAGAALRALEAPVSGPPLSSWLTPTAKVTVVIDDPSLPVPQVSKDPRREMLGAVLALFERHGVTAQRATLLVANGLSRKWREAELAELFGLEPTQGWQLACHDAEDGPELRRIGQEPEGPVEFHRAVVEADVVVHLNVVSLPLYAGTFGLVSGTCGYRTARWLGAPGAVGCDEVPLLPGSAYQRLHQRAFDHLARKVPVFQLSVVMNNEIWNPALDAMMRSGQGLNRPLNMWNAMPAAVRHRAARMLKASYRPTAVRAGPPQQVAPLMLEVFHRQHEVIAEGEADALVFGLPDQGPGSVGAGQNPILSAHLALGFISNFVTTGPLLRAGGVLIFSSPLAPIFDRKAHLPHEEFYEKVLRSEREPQAIHERFEPYFAGRPEFVANYQRRHAFHGAHPLYSWYLTWPARKRAGRIIVAHGDPRACARLGFTPAADVEDALDKVKEYLGSARPRVSVMALPPPLWVRVRS
jgi:lactate racemase